MDSRQLEGELRHHSSVGRIRAFRIILVSGQPIHFQWCPMTVRITYMLFFCFFVFLLLFFWSFSTQDNSGVPFDTILMWKISDILYHSRVRTTQTFPTVSYDSQNNSHAMLCLFCFLFSSCISYHVILDSRQLGGALRHHSSVEELGHFVSVSCQDNPDISNGVL